MQPARPSPRRGRANADADSRSGTKDTKVSFPLDVGSVMAKASFTDASGGDDNFEDAFTGYVTVFNIRPAQCEMLFPLVTYIQADDGTPLFNTGFAIVNPAYEKDSASGALTFTFYKSDIEPVMYDDYRGFTRDRIGRRTEGLLRAAPMWLTQTNFS